MRMDDDAMIFGLFKRRRENPAVTRLYGAVVAQSREPAFYLDLGVEDTVPGRYDLLVLHTFLVFRRLSAGGDLHRQIAQELCDHVFLHLDQTLREMGVGDLSVAKRMKKLAQKFYGRVDAYDRALAADTEQELAQALDRNVYRGNGEATPNSLLLAHYVRDSVRVLDEQDLAEGIPRFAHVPRVSDTDHEGPAS